MGLLDGIEKLINEHGSAVILKERIALANDKFVALEKTLSDSELRAKNCESNNEGLRLDLQNAQEKIRYLEEKLTERHGQRLEELREQLLLLLAQHDGVTDANIAERMGTAKQLVVFHLEELMSAKLVSFAHGIDKNFYGVNVWSIAQDGRRYLVSCGLL